MKNYIQGSLEPKTPGWAVAAILTFFILPAVLGTIRLSVANQVRIVGLFGFIFLLVLLPIGIGIIKGLPRWSFFYFGLIIGLLGVYVVFDLIENRFTPFYYRLMNRILYTKTLEARLLWQFFNQAWFWFSILVAFLVLFSLIILIPPFRSITRRVWRDWTLASYVFYGSGLLLYFIDFDEFQQDEFYQMGCMVSLALGAWGYLRAGSSLKRTLALLAGMTACMAIMGIGKYFLVPIQDWPYWFASHPPEQERWFESLRTIATWFWIVFFIGLPGLLQSLRDKNNLRLVLVEAEI